MRLSSLAHLLHICSTCLYPNSAAFETTNLTALAYATKGFWSCIFSWYMQNWFLPYGFSHHCNACSFLLDGCIEIHLYKREMGGSQELLLHSYWHHSLHSLFSFSFSFLRLEYFCFVLNGIKPWLQHYNSISGLATQKKKSTEKTTEIEKNKKKNN